MPLGSVQKHSAKGNWSGKRKKYNERRTQKISDKINDREINQTVKDLKRVMKAAGKLIDKVNKAINQVDKTVYIARDEQDVTTKEETLSEDTVHINTLKKRKMKTARMETLVDTKKVAELAKALQNLKDVLTGDAGQTDTTEDSGVIEIAAATALDPREEENGEEGMDAAAKAGADDVAAGR